MGFFSGLNDEKYDRQYKDSDLVRRIIGYFGPQTKRLAAVSGLVIVIAGIGAALPVVVSNMVNLLKGEPSLTAISLVGADSAADRLWLMGAELGSAQYRCTCSRRRGSRPENTCLPRRGRT